MADRDPMAITAAAIRLDAVDGAAGRHLTKHLMEHRQPKRRQHCDMRRPWRTGRPWRSGADGSAGRVATEGKKELAAATDRAYSSPAMWTRMVSVS